MKVKIGLVLVFLSVNIAKGNELFGAKLGESCDSALRKIVPSSPDYSKSSKWKKVESVISRYYEKIREVNVQLEKKEYGKYGLKYYGEGSFDNSFSNLTSDDFLLQRLIEVEKFGFNEEDEWSDNNLDFGFQGIVLAHVDIFHHYNDRGDKLKDQRIEVYCKLEKFVGYSKVDSRLSIESTIAGLKSKYGDVKFELSFIEKKEMHYELRFAGNRFIKHHIMKFERNDIFVYVLVTSESKKLYLEQNINKSDIVFMEPEVNAILYTLPGVHSEIQDDLNIGKIKIEMIKKELINKNSKKKKDGFDEALHGL